ncbi:MAG: UDP-N-acetylmuramoyl-L-alanine--D-glutamate ligase [Actinobacteria bacterium]|nr:UDP-N-acetylmuramoyl-L-alanine--D-glutamate ligase [Actinomycetota bacterium]
MRAVAGRPGGGEAAGEGSAPRHERVLVIGLGVSGRAAADKLLREGRKVRVNDISDSEELRLAGRALAERGAEVVLGHHREKVLEGVDLVVVSPGVRSRLPLLREAEARGIPVWSEIELAWRYARGPVVAVTGTNGKTTTVSMIESILRKTGMRARAVGNIGYPMVAAVEEMEPGDILVVEVSSFQLFYVWEFRPRVAVLLNVAGDHLDWHRDLEEYLEAKSRIWMNQGTGDQAVINLDDPLCVEASRTAPAGKCFFSRRAAREACVFREGDKVLFRDPRGGRTLEVMKVEELALRGEHNLENAMAAAAASLLMGAASQAVREALRGYRGLPHRLQRVGERDGVSFYDDSKATNPHAALRALSAFTGPVLLILGGRNKGLSFRELAAEVARKHRRGGIRMVYLIGEAAEEIESAFREEGPAVPRVILPGLEEVFADLPGRAKAGDAVVFSPACASFDRYRDYRERGDHYQKLVRYYLGVEGGG